MAETTRGLKIKVGVLVIVAVVLLLGFLVLLGNLSLGAQRTLYVEFADSGSMLAGAPVKIAGVRAGRVQAVDFLVDREARKSAGRAGAPPVNVRVQLSVRLEMAPSVRQDSTFIITTQGVLGEKYLEIVPGTAGSPEWPDGAYIRGMDPPRMDVLFSRVDAVMAQVQEALSGPDGQIQLGVLVQRVTRLATTLDDLLQRNHGKLDAMLTDLQATTADARVLVAALRQGMGDGSDLQAIQHDARRITGLMAQQLGPTVRATRKTLGKADVALDAATALVERTGPKLDEALVALPGLLAQAEGILQGVAELVDGVKSGQGTVGQLMSDQEIFDDLKEMLRNLKRHPWKMLWRE
jgi:phospholipid/cholesterol/gamma-HCH transport system substrate-binding protein